MVGYDNHLDKRSHSNTLPRTRRKMNTQCRIWFTSFEAGDVLSYGNLAFTLQMSFKLTQHHVPAYKFQPDGLNIILFDDV